ncbi:MAG: leucine-rich repeat protein [Firmicutes bacterium]|nr:leucine-rich repeat protein [Bacillota bacterium]
MNKKELKIGGKTLKRIILAVFVALMVAMASVILIACPPDDEDPELPPHNIGDAAGEWYHDSAAGSEYILRLNADGTVQLERGSVTRAGTVVRDGSVIALNFANPDSTGSAAIVDRAIVVTYGAQEMRFYRNHNYTITFNTHGGSAVSSVQVRNGRTLAEPTTVPTRSDAERGNHIFRGWRVGAGFADRFAFGETQIFGNITLHALFIPPLVDPGEFTIEFDLNYEGQTRPNPAAVTTQGGGVFDLPPVPVRDGFSFGGWWVSMRQDGAYLSYRLTEDTIFGQHDILFALWVPIGIYPQLSAPQVSVSATDISWPAVTGAQSYAITVTFEGSTGFTAINIPAHSGLSLPINFADAPAGNFNITVRANAMYSGNNSVPAFREWRNHALMRVSHFEIYEPSIAAATLIWAPVPNATSYSITVTCGFYTNQRIVLTEPYYEFGARQMRPEGIHFVVRAYADGFVTSVSERQEVVRNLSGAQNIAMNETTQVLSWNQVPDATGYRVYILCGNSNTETVDIVNVSQIDLRHRSPRNGGIVIRIVPFAHGFNSPTAAQHTWNRTTVITPLGVEVVGNELRWLPVDGSNGYQVYLNGNITNIPAGQTYFVITTVGELRLRVRAIGNVLGDSLWSDILTPSIDMVLSYSENTLNWLPVLGADFFEIRINGGNIFATAPGAVSADIVLTQAGTNLIEIRVVENGIRLEWYSYQVLAYTVTFNRQGAPGDTPSQFYAQGDRVRLPAIDWTGYDFMSWRTGPAGGGLPVNAENPAFVSGPRTLYAHWIGIVYNAVLFGGQYTGDSTIRDTIAPRFGDHFSLNIDVVPYDLVNGHLFMGFYTQPNGLGVRIIDESGNSIVPWNIPMDTVLFAFFAPVLSFTEYLYDWIIMEHRMRVARNGANNFINDLTTLSIPSFVNGRRVDYLLPNSFVNIVSLRYVNVSDTVRVMATNSFVNTPGLREFRIVYVPGHHDRYFVDHEGMLIERVIIEGQATGEYLMAVVPSGLEGHLQLPNFITGIRSFAFDGAAGITSVFIPAALELIGTNAFMNARALREVEIEAGSVLRRIGPNAFRNTQLESFFIPNTVRDSDGMPGIGFAAFMNTGMNSIEFELGGTHPLSIPTNSPTFGSQQPAVFMGTNLTSIHFPNRVISIGTQAFSARPGSLDAARGGGTLTEITFEPGVTMFQFPGETEERPIPLTIGTDVNNENISVFRGHPFTSITIPARTIEIGPNAFRSQNQLTAVNFETGGTADLIIGPNSFNSTGLASIRIPARATRIDNAAFGANPTLTNLTFEAGTRPLEIGLNAFSGARFSAVEIPNRATVIGNSAFASNPNLNSVTFAVGGTSTINFGTSVFSGSLMSEIKLPQRTGTLAIGATNTFTGMNNLVNIVIEDGSENFSSIEGVLFNADGTELLLFPSARTGAFTIPGTVRYIGAGSFQGNRNLTHITISYGVREVRLNAFNNTFLRNVTFAAAPSGVTPAAELHIGQNAFRNNSFLASVIFEENSFVRTIGQEAFHSSIALTSVILPETLEDVFEDEQRSRLERRDGPDEEGYYYEDEDGQYHMYRIYYYVSVLRRIGVGVGAFQNNTRLASVAIRSRIGGGPLSIGNNAFSGNLAMTRFEIPNQLAGVNPASFGTGAAAARIAYFSVAADNPVLQSVDGVVYNRATQEDVDAGRAYAVGDATELRIFPFAREGVFNTMPDTVRIIPANAFNQHHFVTEIVIPGSVTFIGNNAFRQNPVTGANPSSTQLDVITFLPGTAPLTIGNNAFEMVRAPLEIPSRTVSFGTAAFQSAGGLGTVILPNAITTLPANVFRGSSIENLIVQQGSQLTSIGNDAFRATRRLSGEAREGLAAGRYTLDFSYATNLTTIGTQVFGSGGGLTGNLDVPSTLSSIILPESVVSIGAWTFMGTPLSSIEFGNNTVLTEFANSLFNGTSITAVPQLTGITRIGDNTFANTNLMRNVLIPASVTTIGTDAFLSTGTHGAHYINFASGSQLRVLGQNAFRNTLSVREINLPQGLEEIHRHAFTNSGLPVLTIPNTVTRIGHGLVDWAEFGTNAHSGSIINGSAVNTVTFAPGGTAPLRLYGRAGGVNSQEAFDNLNFRNCASLAGTLMDHGAFSSAMSLQTVNLPNRLEIIERGVFRRNPALVNVNFEPGQSMLHTIAREAFDNATVTPNIRPATAVLNITIPNSVEFIGQQAFRGMNMTSDSLSFESGGTAPLHIGSGIIGDIADDVFRNNNIAHMTLPARLAFFGNGIFRDNNPLISGTGSDAINGMTGIYIDATDNDGVREGTHYKTVNGVLFSLDGSRLLMFPSAREGTFRIPNTVTLLADTVFMNSRLTEVTFQPYDCSENTLLAPLPLEIGREAFRASRLTTFTFPARTSGFRVSGISATNPTGTGNLFHSVSSLTSVYFETGFGMTDLPGGMFNSTRLTAITIPRSVQRIGDLFFQNVTTLGTIDFETGSEIFRIGTSFIGAATVGNGNAAITSITIPRTLRYMGNNFAQFATNLQTINFEAGSALYSIGNTAFFGTTNLGDVTLPSGLVEVGAGAFRNSGITNVFIPNSVSRFIHVSEAANANGGAFQGTPRLNTVTFEPNGSLHSLGVTFQTGEFGGWIPHNDAQMFHESAVQVINLPSSIGFLTARSFRNADNLREVNIVGANPINFTSIDGVLYATIDNSLVMVPAAHTAVNFVVAPGTTRIHDRAFDPNFARDATGTGNTSTLRNTTLRTITIPNTVTHIGGRAFAGITNLETVIFESGTDTLHFSGRGVGTDQGHLAGIFRSFVSTATADVSGAGASGVFRDSGITHIEIPNRFEVYGALTAANTNARRMFQATPRLATITFEEDSRLEMIPQNFMTGNTLVQSVNWPDSIRGIRADAFQNTNISIDDFLELPNFEEFPNGLFMNTVSEMPIFAPQGMIIVPTDTFRNVTAPSVILSPNTTHLGSNSFNNATLVGLTLPNTLTNIGGNAFQDSNIYNVLNIPASLGSPGAATVDIGTSAFVRSIFTDINIDPSGANNITIGNTAFQHMPNITHMDLPARVNRIGTGVFRDMPNLESVVIRNLQGTAGDGAAHDGVLGGNMFQDSASLYEVAIVGNVRGINTSAFQGTTALRNLDIPVTVEQIAANAFRGTGLESFIVGPNVRLMGHAWAATPTVANLLNPISPFAFALNLEEIIVDQDNTYFVSVDGVLYNHDMTRLIAFPAAKIPNHDGVEGRFVVPDTVTWIGNYAFAGAGGVTELVLPERTVDQYDVVVVPGITHIGVNAFNGSGLVDFILPRGATTIPVDAFNGSRITRLEVPYGVTTIAANAFRNSRIVDLVLPSTVTSMPNNALAGMAYLETITVHEDNRHFATVDGVLYTREQIVGFPLDMLVFAPRGFVPNHGGVEGRFVLPAQVRRIQHAAMIVPVAEIFGAPHLITELVIPSVDFNMTEANFNTVTGWFTNLESITVNATGAAVLAANRMTSVNGVVYDGTATVLRRVPREHIPNYGTPNAGRLTLPNTVTSIAAGAFANVHGITELEIPSSGFTMTPANFRTALLPLINLAYVCIDANTTATATNRMISFDGVVYARSTAAGNPIATLELVPRRNIPNYGEVNQGRLILPSTVTLIHADAFRMSATAASMVAVQGVTELEIPNTSFSMAPAAFRTALEFAVNLAYVCINNTAITAAANRMKSHEGAVYTWTGTATNQTLTVLEFFPRRLIPNQGQANQGRLILPSTVTSIGLNAFRIETGVARMVFVETVTELEVPNAAFTMTADNFINTLSTLTNLEYVCINNTGIAVAANRLKSIDGAVYTWTGTATNQTPTVLVLFPRMLVPNSDGVEGRFVLPATVTGMNNNAFRVSATAGIITTVPGITELIVPNTGFNVAIADLRNHINALPNLAYISINSSTAATVANRFTSQDGVLYNLDMSTLLVFPRGLVPNEGETNEGVFVVPGTVTTIDTNAFANATNVTRLYVPATVTTINANAFSGWTNQQTIIFQGRESAGGNWVATWATGSNANIIFELAE